MPWMNIFAYDNLFEAKRNIHGLLLSQLMLFELSIRRKDDR